MVEFECENISYMPSPQPLNFVIIKKKKKKSGKIKKLEGPRNNEKSFPPKTEIVSFLYRPWAKTRRFHIELSNSSSQGSQNVHVSHLTRSHLVTTQTATFRRGYHAPLPPLPSSSPTGPLQTPTTEIPLAVMSPLHARSGGAGGEWLLIIHPL